MNTLLNLPAIDKAKLNHEPFPYFVVPNAVRDDVVGDVIRDFPQLNAGGSYNVSDVAIGDTFNEFVKSIDTPEFRQLLCNKFDVDIMDLPMLMTLRGISRQKDGRIHSDSKTKIITVLIYLNAQWDASTGLLRILRGKDDLNDYVEEVVPGPGALIAFKVTDNCWHGYVPFVGARQSIQINFLSNESANLKHRFFHGLSARVKSWKK